jgi:hypothetical protein
MAEPLLENWLFCGCSWPLFSSGCALASESGECNAFHREKRHGKEIARQQEKCTRIQKQLTPRGPLQACSSAFTGGVRLGKAQGLTVTYVMKRVFRAPIFKHTKKRMV